MHRTGRVNSFSMTYSAIFRIFFLISISYSFLFLRHSSLQQLTILRNSHSSKITPSINFWFIRFVTMLNSMSPAVFTISYTNSDDLAVFQFFSYCLTLSVLVHRISLPRTEYCYPIQTLCLKYSHNSFSKLFYLHHLLPTRHPIIIPYALWCVLYVLHYFSLEGQDAGFNSLNT